MPTLTESIMKASPFSRITISAAIVALVGFLAYNWAVSPQASYIQAAQRYENLSMDIEKKTKVMTNSVRIRKTKLEKLRSEIKTSAEYFFSPDQAADFFAGLEKFSTAAGCTLGSVVFDRQQDVTPGKNKTDDLSVTEKNARLSIVGTYSQVVGLTSALKEYPHRIYIRDLQLEPAESSADKLSCSMKIMVYITEDKELLSDE